MKFLSFTHHGRHHVGLYHEAGGAARVLSLTDFFAREKNSLPATLEEIIRNYHDLRHAIEATDRALKNGDYQDLLLPYASLHIDPPIARPASARDAYAFRQHVASARQNRGVPMIPEFDQFPIFYFTNHHSIIGPGPVPCMKDHFDKLDFELEAAVVLGRRGRNIQARDADAYIFGYTILNDWSARTLQMEEMLLSLGPAKGKDFANSIGPLLVTPDELADVITAPRAGHTGSRHALTMTCRVNGKEVSRGNLGDMDWTFAEIIERCAYGADVFPTDLIGSGTVGTGCLLELNGTGKRLDSAYQPWWLQAGDFVELTIDRLGVLQNTIVQVPAPEGELSLLAKKHV